MLKSMKAYQTCVKQCYVYEGERHHDNRGHFSEIYKSDHNIINPLQANLSVSRKHVLRGMHVAPFKKYVTCVKGKIFDVVADTRPESETYLKWHGQVLSEDCSLLVLAPPNCAHGFLAMEDSVVIYLQDGKYDPKVEWGISYADPQLGIVWPGFHKWFILSEKDEDAEFLA